MKLPIWEPSTDWKKKANMTRFIDFVNKRYGQNFDLYDDLYNWSINNLPDFWASVWAFIEIRASTPYHTVVTDPSQMLGCKWFQGARLNFAENLLRCRDDRTALVFKGGSQDPVRLTYAQLYDQVARLAKSLIDSGAKVDNRRTLCLREARKYMDLTPKHYKGGK